MSGTSRSRRAACGIQALLTATALTALLGAPSAAAWAGQDDVTGAVASAPSPSGSVPGVPLVRT